MKRLAAFLVLSVLLILPTQGKADDPVIYLRFSDSTSLDPGLSTTQYNGEVVSNIFEGLVQYKRGSNKISPCLAKKWIIFEEGKRWRFFLRKNVHFHDGKLLNAKDIVYSFRARMKQKDKKYLKWSLYFPYIKEIKQIDNLTVDIILEKPFAPFLTLLTDPVAYIIKEGSYETGNFNPVGTGPFIFSSWIREKHIILKRNKIYWEKKIRLPRIIFKIIPNIFLRINMIRSGQAHVMEVRSAAAYSYFIGNQNVSVTANPPRSIFYLTFNTFKTPFDKVEVRRAFAHLINKDVLIRQVYENFAIPASTHIPPQIMGFNREIKSYPFDLIKAKKLLKKAGILSGFSCSITYLEGDLGEQRIADSFVRNGRKLGININKNPLPFNKIWSVLRERSHDIAIRGWIAGPDPDIYLFPNFTMKNGNSNWAGYSDPKLTTLLVNGRETLEENKRIQFYKRAQEIIYRDVPSIPLMHMKYLTVQHHSIKNVYMNSNLYIIFKDAYRVE